MTHDLESDIFSIGIVGVGLLGRAIGGQFMARPDTSVTASWVQPDPPVRSPLPCGHRLAASTQSGRETVVDPTSTIRTVWTTRTGRSSKRAS